MNILQRLWSIIRENFNEVCDGFRPLTLFGKILLFPLMLIGFIFCVGMQILIACVFKEP